MSRYRKIDQRIWNDEKFRLLDDSAKLLFFCLLTHPSMTMLGAMRSTVAGLAEELGWSVEAFREAFQQVLDKGMAEHEQKAHLIALPNFLVYNKPESPNVVKSWSSVLDMLPECALKIRVVARCRAFAEGMSEGFAEALPVAFRQPMPNQEQEQEQDQEQKARTGVGAAAAAPAAPATPTKRAHRLPEDFTLPKAWGEATLAEFPYWPADYIRLEAAKFRDHWVSKSGKDATKLDWMATWRNWCRNARGPAAGTAQRGPMTDAARAAANAASTAAAAKLLGFDKPAANDDGGEHAAA